MTQDNTPSEDDLQPWPTNEDGSPRCIPCENCGMGAIAIMNTPGGCVVFPGKPRLAVCPQHLNNWGFIEDQEPVVLLAEIQPGIARWAGY